MSTPTKEILARDAFLSLTRLHDRLSGQFAVLFREAGVTQAQYNVLRILIGAGSQGAACQEIGSQLVQRVPDVTRLVDRMVRAGLVTRERTEEDRRVVRIRVSPKGKRICAGLEQPVLDLHRKQLDHLSRAQLAILQQSLQAALA